MREYIHTIEIKTMHFCDSHLIIGLFVNSSLFSYWWHTALVTGKYHTKIKRRLGYWGTSLFITK